MSVRILIGDVRARLAELPDESVHCVVTSPPYLGLRDYGIEPVIWGGDDGCAHEWGTGPKKKTDHVGTARWNHAVNGRGEEQPASKRVSEPQEILQGAFCRLCDAWRGSLGLEPTPDLYVEHLVAVFRAVRRVLRKDGTVWLNLGDSYANDSKWGGSTGGKHAGGLHGKTGIGRQKTSTGLKPKDLMMIPERAALALQADGWWVRSRIIWAKPNPMPESVTDRPTSAHEHIWLLSKSARYFYDAEAAAEPAIKAGRVVHSYGTGAKDRLDISEVNDRRTRIGLANWNKPVPETKNLRNVWTIATAPYPDAHFATFPPALVEPCIKAGCPIGGTVLDPFGGAGTTGLVADRLQRDAILIEIKPEYAAMAGSRIRQAGPLLAAVETVDAGALP